MLACSAGTCAATSDSVASMFSFGGFGTLGVVHSSDDKADFIASSFQPDGAGYSHHWSASVDSLIGAQVTANFSPTLSAVLQGVSEQNYNNTWTPHIEWANLKWQITPDFNLRVGRTALPNFLYSDTRLVGYTNPWVRLPLEVYSLVPITSNDGVDAGYRFAVGTASNAIQIAVGRTDANLPAVAGHSSSTAHSRRSVSLSDFYEQGFTTLHFSYGQARVTIPKFDGLFDAFRQFGPLGMAIADRYEVHNTLVTFFGVGADYEPGKWYAMGEWAHQNTHSALGEATGWYVSTGYHMGKFTPYATFASIRADSSTFDSGLTLSALPAQSAMPAAALNEALNTILGSIARQNTSTLGLRWDLVRHADLTAQFDRTRLGAGSFGTLTNLQPGFQRGTNLNLFSLALDFVF